MPTLHSTVIHLFIPGISVVALIIFVAILCIEETAYNHVTLYIYPLKGQSWKNIQSDILYDKG